MKNIITYVLFGTQPLYWRNIPLIAIANELYYPGFETRIYIHRDSKSIPIYGLLEALHDEGCLDIVVYDDPVVECKHACWRFKPLWEPEVQNVWCRDLDSIPHSEEVKAGYCFLNSTFAVHSVRGIRWHSQLMAGLCGFNRTRVALSIPKTFQDFLGDGDTGIKGEPRYARGYDQVLLKKWFMKLGPQTLDNPSGGAFPVEGSTAKIIPASSYRPQVLESIPPWFVTLCDKIAVHPGKAVCFYMADILSACRTNARSSKVVSKFLDANEQIKGLWV